MQLLSYHILILSLHYKTILAKDFGLYAIVILIMYYETFLANIILQSIRHCNINSVL